VKGDESIVPSAGAGLAAVGGTEEIEVLSVDETTANRIHLQLLDLKARYDEVNYQMAELLYQVDTNHLYRKVLTGFSKFEDYVVTLGVGARKARYLVAIWEWFMVKHDDQQMAAGMYDLEWSKAKELVEIVTPDNASDWFERAKASSVKQLVAARRVAKQKAKGQLPSKPSKKKETPTPPVKRRGKAGNEPATAGAAAPSDDEINEELNKNGDWRNLAFRVHRDWMETIRLALSEAKELGGGRIQHDGYALEMICLSFCSEMASDVDRDRRLEWLAWAERVTGVTLIGVDEMSGKLVYGEEAASRLAKRGKSTGKRIAGDEVKVTPKGQDEEPPPEAA